MRPNSLPEPKVAFVHAGARFHYALAVAMQRAGVLDKVYLDWFVTPGSLREKLARAVRLVNRPLGQRMLDRSCPDLDAAKVAQAGRLGLLFRQRFTRRQFRSPLDRHAWKVAEEAAALLRRGFGDANAVMAYVRDADPSLWAESRRRGLVTVGDQLIAPAAVENDEAQEQMRRWPGWQNPDWAATLMDIDDLERRSWATLDHLTCGSDYVKEGLVREGVEASRVSVLPYPIEARNYPLVDRRRSNGNGPVTVGFVGAVNLRKGAPYFIEVAKRLKARALRFVMVGPNQLEQPVVDKHTGFVEIVGPVPRSEVANWLRQFDMILFPTTCEGSATALMEAMATGLPVVTSPNSGTVARNGTESFITAYDQVEEMASYVERLASDANLRHEMGLAGRRRVESFGIDWYAGEIGPLFRRLLPERVKGPESPAVAAVHGV